MKIANHLIFEVEKNDHVFTFTVPTTTNWRTAYDACFMVLTQIYKLSEEAEKAKSSTTAADEKIKPDDGE